MLRKISIKNTVYIFLFILLLLISGCATVPQNTYMGMRGVYHIVGSGQTLWGITKTYNVDMHEIMRINKIQDPNYIGVGQELFIPYARQELSVERYRPVANQTVEGMVGPKDYFSRWCYITVHHSATTTGNAEAFDRNHRIRRMGGLFYHFVIGNGTGSSDGELEVGWRWSRQKYVERPFDIQICLVGDFSKQRVSLKQYATLLKLISILEKQYNIPAGNIRRHKDVSESYTECPGSNFPFTQLLTDLKSS